MYKILDHYILLFKRKNFIFTCFIMVFFSTTAFAQRVTNIDKKGTERTTGNIVTESATAPTVPTPIQGDIWVDTTTNTTKFWDGNSWEPIQASSAFALIDTDGDTQILVEETADDDTIRFDTAGTERAVTSSTIGIK